jgi:hypothetical protein
MSKVRKSRKKRVIISIISVVSFIAILVGSFFIYVSIYNHATDNAVSYMSDSILSEVKDEDEYVTFQPKVDKVTQINKSGIIFYPGGKVEYKAYAPILRNLSDLGIASVLVKMPFNLAVFNVNGAKGKSSLFPKIENWYIAGHSLGGAMACSYLEKNYTDYKGLILMGSYSTVDLSKTGLSTLSLLAENDQVMNKEKYESNKKYLPNLTEYTISGGIHSYFGDYGVQSGDGTPSISLEEQQNQIVLTISTFVRANSLLN